MWTINLVLEAFSEIVGVRSLVNSEDLYEVCVAVARQDSMSSATVNAVLSGYCNRFVGYP